MFKKVKSVEDAIQKILKGEILYKCFIDQYFPIDIVKVTISDLHKFYYKPSTVHRMMTSDEARSWANNSRINERWLVRRITENVWRFPNQYTYQGLVSNYQRVELIEGQPFTPIDFSIEVEE